jgi:hypothetical protein
MRLPLTQENEDPEAVGPVRGRAFCWICWLALHEQIMQQKILRAQTGSIRVRRLLVSILVDIPYRKDDNDLSTFSRTTDEP